MALALYRKYRPGKLGDLLGQEMNVSILQDAARQDRLGQAYLFYGPRGTGKTSTARLIAKLANCEKRHTDPKFRAVGEPCNTCRVCKEIEANASLGVIEIDAASNRGIDEIRNLKEDIQVAPAGTARKVYIIDEVHMMTPAAFNALLKTLEEPPKHAMFILATTEYEKLPATIVSRAQRFLFKKLPKTKILEKLKKIVKAEKISIDDDALELVAAAADGSFRDAESLLEQLSSLATKINLQTAEHITGRTGFKTVDRLAELALRRDLKAALAYTAELGEEGVNVVQLVRDFIHYMRKIITLNLSPDVEQALRTELTAEELKRLAALAKLAEPSRDLKLVHALIRAYAEMRYSPFATIPLEVALIEHLSAPG
jgi:DNA polymerase-3 subunit gamma/tau